MFTLIRSWQQSGQSQLVFCKEKEIAYSHFHYWYKKFRMHKQKPVAKPAFTAIQVQLPTSHIFCTVHLGDGVSVDFHQVVSADFIVSLLN